MLDTILSQLRQEREQLDRAISVIEGLAPATATPAKTNGRAHTGWTPAKRRKHAKMMRERWAKKRKGA